MEWLKAIKRHVFESRSRKSSNTTEQILKLFKGKRGLEVGGPSQIFSLELPLYTVVKGLDCCNFSNSTVWEGSIKGGFNYNFLPNKVGYQFIDEASDLKRIEDNKYDFVVASHCLEHCANPIKTIKEWLRVIKSGGLILLVLPKKEYTFDHRRPVTTFEHLLADYASDVDETDLTHFEEIITYHDLTLDIPAGDIDSFKSRSLKNYQNRCLHHHVFDFDLLVRVFTFFNMDVIYKEFKEPYHQIIAGAKK